MADQRSGQNTQRAQKARAYYICGKIESLEHFKPQFLIKYASSSRIIWIVCYLYNSVFSDGDSRKLCLHAHAAHCAGYRCFCRPNNSITYLDGMA